jgi:hypothetical protein
VNLFFSFGVGGEGEAANQGCLRGAKPLFTLKGGGRVKI